MKNNLFDKKTLSYIHKEKTTVINEKNEVYYITFPKLDQYKTDMIHAFSTRLGGVSKNHFSSMNLSFTRGDDEELVRENHRLFANAIGYDEKKLVFSNQVHLTRFHKVTKEDAGKGIIKESDIVEIDGLVTDEVGIPLITFYADCVPLFFYDPGCHVIAMAHSGWRGTVHEIGAKMVAYMHSEYGSKPQDIICAIGPSICQSCYEVSEDVANEIYAVYGNDCGKEIIYPTGNQKYQLNLHQACLRTLLNAGISREHIDVTDLCTCCNSDFLFSHRKSNGKRGNLAGVMMLQKR
ncbi:MAG: peptidoglycan editing factor PgeF [Eubacteriales bacterium]|nr:peptidoglycan editing factor PgeF [Eubacteriales bacterium]